jgi:hypothetical protein
MVAVITIARGPAPRIEDIGRAVPRGPVTRWGEEGQEDLIVVDHIC